MAGRETPDGYIDMLCKEIRPGVEEVAKKYNEQEKNKRRRTGGGGGDGN